MEKKQIDKIDLLHLKIESLQKAINKLKQEKEDLKCCGNCKTVGFSNKCKCSIVEIERYSGGCCCENWEKDGFKNKHRIIRHD